MSLNAARYNDIHPICHVDSEEEIPEEIQK